MNKRTCRLLAKREMGIESEWFVADSVKGQTDRRKFFARFDMGYTGDI
jgi:hypothetical protein